MPLTKGKRGTIDLNRKKIRGREAKVYVGIPPVNSRARLADQILYTSGFNSLITIGGTATAGSYTIPIASINYTYVATGADTNETIRDGLIAVIMKAGVAVKATAPGVGSGGDRTFYLVSDTTFAIGTTVAPAPGTLANTAVSGAATGAKGAVSISLLRPTTTEMQANQYLMFNDSDDFEFIAKLSANAPVGSTSLAVESLPEKIPAGSTAEFPVYVFDLTNSGISRSYNLAAATDYNSGSDRDGVITGGEKSIALPGNFAYKNAGGLTLAWAGEAGNEVILERRFDPPSAAYKSGEIIWGAGVVTGDNDTAENEGFITRDREFAFLGKVTTIDAQPT
ncbi:hypothetical protein [Pseudanabaena sp. PCC 6802]|uniref:hypothetical protein n=1 Tax=Pseudanabaena sp. PCC 6802 TaxID=118173 RepID=UPI00034A1789|nr:hypothetical protein [Pseudanabaena sp. PCC 6802]